MLVLGVAVCGDGRALVRGELWQRSSGRLLATTVQEGVLRLLRPIRAEQAEAAAEEEATAAEEAEQAAADEETARPSRIAASAPSGGAYVQSRL